MGESMAKAQKDDSLFTHFGLRINKVIKDF